MSVDFNASFSGSAETFGAKMTETPASMTASMKETGGGSASNYEALRNKPKINGHELIGDMTPAQLGITDAKELEKHTYIKTRNPAVFPKKERLGLAQRMMNEASDLVADLMEANDLLLTDPEERELRYRAQRSALRNCRKLIHHIELAHEILSGFGDDAFAYWAKMAAGVKNQTAKWYKTDKERAAKLDAQKRHQ